MENIKRYLNDSYKVGAPLLEALELSVDTRAVVAIDIVQWGKGVLRVIAAEERTVVTDCTRAA